MKFGLDANIAHPLLSAIYSIFLIFGCDFSGFYILKLFQGSLGQIKNTWIRWQAPIMGALLLRQNGAPSGFEKQHGSDARFAFSQKNQQKERNEKYM